MSIEEFRKRQARIVAMREFEKQVTKELLDEARRPEWVKMQDYGDYIPGLDDGEGPRGDDE